METVRAKPTAMEDVEGKAYLDQMVSVDGFTRTATGAVKFHKDTKKRRALEMEHDNDVDMDDAAAAAAADKKARKPQVVKLGREFKAKVRLDAGVCLNVY